MYFPIPADEITHSAIIFSKSAVNISMCLYAFLKRRKKKSEKFASNSECTRLADVQ